MVNDPLNQWVKMTPQQLTARGFSPKSERYVNRFTGEDVSRRSRENRRAQQIGYSNYSEFQRLKTNRMYQVFERIRSTQSGGVPIKDLRNLSTPEGREFNRQVAASITNGKWDKDKTGGLFNYLGLSDKTATGVIHAFGNYPVEIGKRTLK